MFVIRKILETEKVKTYPSTYPCTSKLNTYMNKPEFHKTLHTIKDKKAFYFYLSDSLK